MLTPQQHEQLISRMQEFLLLPVPMKIHLKQLNAVSMKAGTVIVRPGSRQSVVTFILQGSAVQTDHQKNYLNLWTSNDWVYTAPGFFSQQPADSTVTLLEDSILIQLSWVEYQQMEKEFPLARPLSEMIRDHYEKKHERREYDLSHKTNEQRYLEFQTRYRDILYRCPKTKIARYLGMTYKSFSRYHHPRNARSRSKY